MKVLIILTTFIFAGMAGASVSDAERLYNSGGKDKFINVAEELADEGLYFTAVPFIKEYLSSSGGQVSGKVDEVIDRVATYVGMKQFEVLPENILKRSGAPILRYILARKAYRLGKYQQTLDYLKSGPKNGHSAYPFALLLKASTEAVLGRNEQAAETFKQCKSYSDSYISRADTIDAKRQISINRDNCVVGVGRAYFAAGKFDQAKSAYLDLDKDSHVWPEILFEEAWTSFYERDFNRTLGKLVTYKAPVLDYIFNPEIEILNALTYLEMCLYSDARKSVEDFYQKYQKQAVGLQRFIGSYGKKYKAYYLLAKKRKEGPIKANALINQLFNDITRDPAYRELYNYFENGKKELAKLKSLPRNRFRGLLGRNLKESLLLQRDLVGAYARRKIRQFDRTLYKSFQDMSYIKLEILQRRKSDLYYSRDSKDRQRGDIQYLNRTEKQYFWTFNGEFWADELGDYVFSLKSECRG